MDLAVFSDFDQDMIIFQLLDGRGRLLQVLLGVGHVHHFLHRERRGNHEKNDQLKNDIDHGCHVRFAFFRFLRRQNGPRRQVFTRIGMIVNCQPTALIGSADFISVFERTLGDRFEQFLLGNGSPGTILALPSKTPDLYFSRGHYFFSSTPILILPISLPPCLLSCSTSSRTTPCFAVLCALITTSSGSSARSAFSETLFTSSSMDSIL